MRAPVSNAAYGVLDYVAWPIGMLLVAPGALQELGTAQFGIWMVANAALTIGSIVASGFGDANIRSVAVARGKGNREALTQAVRATLGIHLILGTAVGLTAWALAPAASARIASQSPAFMSSSVWCLRIAAVLMLVRAIETVCVSTQRAFERYGAAVFASVAGRLLALAGAAFSPLARRGVVAVAVVAGFFILCALAIQLGQLARLLGPKALQPSFDRAATLSLLGFGVFSWIQAVSGVVFTQADRLLTGIYFGAASVAAYALCAQLAQPIYGIAASGLHFLFPYVSSRAKADSLSGMRRPILLTLAANLLMVALGGGILTLWGHELLAKWVGPSMAQAGEPILPLLVWSAAAQGLSITGVYTLLAIGQVRWVTLLSLAGGSAMLIAAPLLLRKYGIEGMALARLLYGPCTLLVYIPLAALLWRGSGLGSAAETVRPVCGEAAR